MLRAGVIGLGFGQTHARAYHLHPVCRLEALCDMDPVRLRAVAQEYPGVRLYERAEDLLRDPGLDVVSIASHDHQHFEQAALALAQGKHVFVEKPLCQQAGQLRELAALLRSHPRLCFSSNLLLRTSPRFQELRAMIKQGGMGRLFYLEGSYNYGRLHKITQGWRGRLPYYSVIQGGGIHLLDLMLWLSGERVTEVAAFGNNLASQGSGFAFPDMVAALLKFSGGLVAKLGANFGCVSPHFHELNVYGAQATFLNRPEAALLYTSREEAEPPQTWEAPLKPADKLGVINSFIQAIVTSGQPLVTAQEALDCMAVCLAIDRAWQESAVVEVEYV